MTDAESPSAPPYIPWGTFESLVDDLRAHTPRRVDRSIVSNKRSGTVARKLLYALRFLGLITESGDITDSFHRYLKAGPTEAPATLKSILMAAYGERLQLDELAHITAGEFDEKFSGWVRGDTVRKAKRFLLDAARAAEIPISPRLVARASATKKTPSKNGTKSGSKSGAVAAPRTELPLRGQADTRGANPPAGKLATDALDQSEADLYERILRRYRERPDGFEFWLEVRLELLRERIARGSERGPAA